MRDSVVIEELNDSAWQDKPCARQGLLLLATWEIVDGLVLDVQAGFVYLTEEGVHLQSRPVMPLQPALHGAPPPLSNPQNLAGCATPHHLQSPT